MQIITQPESFEGSPIDVIIMGGEKWVGGPQIGAALGFADPAKAMRKIYSRSIREFDDSTNIMIEMPTAGGRQLVRLYNARGAALIAMKAQTPKGEAFRRWVLDVLEGKAEVGGDDRPLASGEMIASVAARLRHMFIETSKMRQLIRYRDQGLNRGEIAKLLDVSGTYVSSMTRVAEFLGLLQPDSELERYRATPQYHKFIEGKRAYNQRKKANQALQSVAADLDGVQLLAAPTGEATDGQ